jgi:serine/threonine protein kinase
MGVLDVVRKKIRLISVLVTRKELKSVLAFSVLEPHDIARYKTGNVIRTESPFGDLKVYGVKSGGYGIVYIVLDEDTLTPYCLKTSRDRFLKKPDRTNGFMQEAETWLRLGKHPNIVYAHSVFKIGGRPHILLEYVAGSDLWSSVKQGPLPLKTALRYAIQFCRGMVYAQSKLPGFVHGDIKPNNCLVTMDGIIKITDFGQVRSWAKRLTCPLSNLMRSTKQMCAVMSIPSGLCSLKC